MSQISQQPSQQRFQEEVSRPNEAIAVAKAALYIAQSEYPDLDIDTHLIALDRMAEAIAPRLPKERYPLRVLQEMSRYLHQELGFDGDRDNYYDPRNSYLNQVLSRRRGIPITLSLVYLEVAKRLELPMVGIGMPGHFLIRPEFEDAGIFIDAFNGGEILFEQDCQQILQQIYQQPIPLEPQYLAPVSSRQLLLRMLTNLKIIYINQQQLDRILTIVEYILLLVPEAEQEKRDRGLLYYQLGEWDKAKTDLEDYLAAVPQAEDATLIQRILARMQS